MVLQQDASHSTICPQHVAIAQRDIAELVCFQDVLFDMYFSGMGVSAMKNLLDALWRAVAYCLYPRVLLLTCLPLLIMLVLVAAFAWWGWQPVVQWMASWLQGSMLHGGVARLGQWLQWPQLVDALPAMLVLTLAGPLAVLLTLVLVELMISPMLLRLVVQRRFASLQRQQGAGTVTVVAWTLGHVLLACVLLLLSLPLWPFLPPIPLLLPPLLWGWVSYRTMSFDTLAEFASKTERRILLHRHRGALLLMGIITGLLGVAPGVVWLSAVVFAIGFVVLIPVAIWIYALVLTFSYLWFAHFCLAALEQLRQQQAQEPMDVTSAPLPDEQTERINP